MFKFNSLLWGLSVSIACAAMSATPTASAPVSFSGLYVFGDSLSDTGNVSIASGGFIPPPPSYDDGRFSNGPLWIEYLASRLHLSDPAPYAAGVSAADDSISFAYGGAGAGLSQVVPAGVPIPGLLGQVQLFDALVGGTTDPTPGTADPNALYVIWSGGNDYLLSGPPTSGYTPDPGLVTSEIGTAIQDLHTAGARNFLVLNLPNLGDVPLTRALPAGTSDALNAVTAAHNAALDAALAGLSSQYGDSTLRLFDVHDWVARVLADPGAFGFSYGLTAGPAAGCLFPPLSCPDLTGEFDTAGQGRFFWDELHPTTQVHRLLADEAFAALGGVQPVPEPPAATIFVLALAGLALTLRGIGRTARRGAD